MKLFWQDRPGDSLLLAEPAAKLASVEQRNGKFYFKCLSLYEQIRVETLTEAKRWAETRLRSVLLSLYDSLLNESLPNVKADVGDAGSSGKR